jgi:hypothetical protein
MSDKTIIVGEGYNEGDKYEDKITKILINKKILPTNYKRAGATHRSDIEINYKNKNINVEIKNKNKGADYGQKELKWSKEKKFYWTEKDPNDPIVKLYYRLNIIKKYLNKDYIPRRYSVDIHKLTKIDKQFDLDMCKKTFPIPLKALFLYYENKKCYYIQIEKSGFYHLEKDIFNLGTPRYDGKIGLRLRTKTRSSKKIYMYGLLGKIALLEKPTPSTFDLEELDGRDFPFKV